MRSRFKTSEGTFSEQEPQLRGIQSLEPYAAMLIHKVKSIHKEGKGNARIG